MGVRLPPHTHQTAYWSLAAGGENPLPGYQIQILPKKKGGGVKPQPSPTRSPGWGQAVSRGDAGERSEPVQGHWEEQEGLHAPGKAGVSFPPPNPASPAVVGQQNPRAETPHLRTDGARTPTLTPGDKAKEMRQRGWGSGVGGQRRPHNFPAQPRFLFTSFQA